MQTEPCTGCGTRKPAVLLIEGLCNLCNLKKANAERLEHREKVAKAPFRPEQVSMLSGAAAPIEPPPSSIMLTRKAMDADLKVQAEAAKADQPLPVAEAVKKELATRELARRHFLPFVTRFTPDYHAGWVHREIAHELEQFMQAVERRESPRLMIFMPPRAGKSQLTSKSYPAWVLGHHPEWEFMLTSYSGALANRFSREVRGIMRDQRYHALFDTRLDPDTQSVELWQTTDGGGLLAAGVGGPITGSGAHILLIDDPVKNRDEADSAQVRQVTKDWYSSTAYTRLAPGGGILIIQTRWHTDDLSGWLLREMEQNDGEHWRVISYPAIALQDEKHRKEGEALHPERYDELALARIRKAVGERDWWALYQQKPVSDEGAYFTRDMFSFYTQQELEAKRREMNHFVAWDLAIGQTQANDYSVGLVAAVDREENLWIVGHQRGRWDSSELVERIIDLHVKHKAELTGLEHGQIHMTIRPFLDRRVAERREWTMRYEPLKTGKRDKVARARSIQGMLRLGKVRLPRPEDAPWVQDFINECLHFPVGTNDDQVDAFAWLGLMISEMYSTVPLPEPKKPSWKDRLDQFVIGGGRHKSAMSA